MSRVRLQDFVVAVTRAIERDAAETALLPVVRRELAALLANDDWLLPKLAEPHPQFFRQYLLYADPLERFSVVSFVHGPGQRTPIHDHTVWGFVGTLRGSEVSEMFEIDADGKLARVGVPAILHAGNIEVVSPTLGDIHRVGNASDERVAVSIHVYGGNIGTIQRNVFADDGTRSPFVSSYNNDWIPNLWDRSREATR